MGAHPAALAARTRVVAYDRAGLALLRATGGGPCVLVGNSWGAMLAQLTAWTAPELVAGLVLVDPAHEDFQPWTGLVRDWLMLRWSVWRKRRGLLDRDLRADAVATACRLTDDAHTRDLLVAAELACYAHPHPLRAIVVENQLAARNARMIRKLRARVPLPDVPVVVLSATRGLPTRMRARWTALQGRIATAAAQGEHIVVPEAGHYVHHSRPEVAADAVLSVLDRLPA
jgi:pimeloyl-ACP methyl ester carboxylesterase